MTGGPRPHGTEGSHRYSKFVSLRTRRIFTGGNLAGLSDVLRSQRSVLFPAKYEGACMPHGPLLETSGMVVTLRSARPEYGAKTIASGTTTSGRSSFSWITGD